VGDGNQPVHDNAEMTRVPANLRSLTFGLLAALSLVPLALAPIASAGEVSPAVISCVQKALGAKAAGVMSGSDKAMAQLSSRERGLVEGCLVTNGRAAGKAAKQPSRLTVSPMDPSIVTSMSKFRACAGHDFSGLNLQGQSERNRSMKHYVYVDAPWTATGAVQVRAPISGTAIGSVEKNYPLGSWVRILDRKGWVFTAFHVDAKVRDGQKVKAGDVIATFPPANAPTFMPDRMAEPPANLDLTLQSTDGRMASFIDWLTPSARKAWESRGFSSESLTITKDERDAQPCASDFPDGPGSTGFVMAVADS